MKCISWYNFIRYRILASVINVRNDELIIAFGIRVRELRKEKGYTMEKLAELAGIDARQLSYVELGKNNTSISMMYAIAKALNVSLSMLTQLDDF
ncbi:helix-turn-helix domain-containing protein [Mucilaginibacter sp. UR6-11]|uniref:helix-turn-helix domain-containing protein n=1 Tax=Mucilaginibacter sp. UR6-11 TaxID=1435644 RepID=UPI001E405E14|nr:helix-turn-helix transcriptional regulator [Mucilaginibacter sp. UR6-11]MCC8427302.1 helix-turn-helix domain-containing protein [Mucilaginibacter sp. UR6-11]